MQCVIVCLHSQRWCACFCIQFYRRIFSCANKQLIRSNVWRFLPVESTSHLFKCKSNSLCFLSHFAQILPQCLHNCILLGKSRIYCDCCCGSCRAPECNSARYQISLSNSDSARQNTWLVAPLSGATCFENSNEQIVFTAKGRNVCKTCTPAKRLPNLGRTFTFDFSSLFR